LTSFMRRTLASD